MPKVPHILKTLYDLDILDEEVLIEWGAKVRIHVTYSEETFYN